MQLIKCFMVNVTLEMALMMVCLFDFIFEPSFSEKRPVSGRGRGVSECGGGVVGVERFVFLYVLFVY